MQVQIYRDGEGIIISVRDPGCSGCAEAAVSEVVEVGGRLGLMIVDALARRWGGDRDEGYHVWAELVTRQEEPPEHAG